MDGIVNLELIKNPLNWITVLLMVMIGAFAADLIYNYVQSQNSGATQ